VYLAFGVVVIIVVILVAISMFLFAYAAVVGVRNHRAIRREWNDQDRRAEEEASVLPPEGHVTLLMEAVPELGDETVIIDLPARPGKPAGPSLAIQAGDPQRRAPQAQEVDTWIADMQRDTQQFITGLRNKAR